VESIPEIIMMIMMIMGHECKMGTVWGKQQEWGWKEMGLNNIAHICIYLYK
jgi:hypothetical protein